MAEQTDAPGPAPIKDHRVMPRGVLPRGFQTWLMAGLALGIVLIVLLTGHPEPPARPPPSRRTRAARSRPARTEEKTESNPSTNYPRGPLGRGRS